MKDRWIVEGPAREPLGYAARRRAADELAAKTPGAVVKITGAGRLSDCLRGLGCDAEDVERVIAAWRADGSPEVAEWLPDRVAP